MTTAKVISGRGTDKHADVNCTTELHTIHNDDDSGIFLESQTPLASDGDLVIFMDDNGSSTYSFSDSSWRLRRTVLMGSNASDYTRKGSLR